MGKATYPGGIFQWTPRVDVTNIVFANDPNSLATEIQGVETTIGTNPQIEASPPAGSAVTYATLSARVSAANNNSNIPYAVLKNIAGFFINAGQQKFNTYNTVSDPYGIWNGQDLTIPCAGYWSLHADQKWNQHGNNFRGGNVLFLYLNGNWIASDIWDWSAAFGNTQYNYASNVFQSNGYTRLAWEGLLNKGDRIQILSANSTFCPGIQITNMSLHTHCVRTVSGSFQSG